MAVSFATGEGLGVSYARLEDRTRLPDDTLLAVTYGNTAPAAADPRAVRVGLEPLTGPGSVELWRGSGCVETGRKGAIRFATDADYLAGILEVDEREYDGIAGAARAAYRAIAEFMCDSPYRHLLRMWNILEGINRGTGNGERYRQFCIGRAAGLEEGGAGPRGTSPYPAATAVGRLDGTPVLQVYWLAGRSPGTAFENPRQLSAYQYPQQYGPTPPSFSRAMLVGGRSLLVSGTASIVGHATHHAGDAAAQFTETVANLRALLASVAKHAPGISPEPGTRGLLKVYLRNRGAREEVSALLRQQLPTDHPPLLLAADICRADLQLEIECAQIS